MSTSLMERANAIIEDCADDYSALPIEERKRIGRYMAYEKILTVVQMVEKDRTHTTEAWRKIQMAWLRGLVITYEHDEWRRMTEEAEERSGE